MGSIPTRSQFFFLSLSFFSPLHFSLLFFSSFFCPPLISSSPFPLPSFLFSFSYSFPIHFLFLVSFFLLLVSFFLSLSAAFLSLFSLYFILLIAYSFSPPLSFSLFLFFLPLNSLLFYQGGCYERKGK